MTELETAEAFAKRMSHVAEGECPCADCLLPLIEADRAAVSLCAKRDLLEEIRRSAAALDDTGLTFTPAQAIVAAVCQADTKYRPPAEDTSDGPTPTVPGSPKDQ